MLDAFGPLEGIERLCKDTCLPNHRELSAQYDDLHVAEITGHKHAIFKFQKAVNATTLKPYGPQGDNRLRRIWLMINNRIRYVEGLLKYV